MEGKFRGYVNILITSSRGLPVERSTQTYRIKMTGSWLACVRSFRRKVRHEITFFSSEEMCLFFPSILFVDIVRMKMIQIHSKIFSSGKGNYRRESIGYNVKYVFSPRSFVRSSRGEADENRLQRDLNGGCAVSK